MNTQTSGRPSATIYEFPIGGRAGRIGSRPSSVAINEFQAAATCHDVMGGSWYHEAAIREADGTFKA